MNEWRPTASWDALRRRAALLAGLRGFFAERGVLEVETPILCSAGSTDPHLNSFSTSYYNLGDAVGHTLYLHTSPELAMKRLLAAGSGPIYQITKAFRNGEAGRLHNPEFTLLEWYQPGFDHHALMDEVDALLHRVLDLSPAPRIAYGKLFEQCLAIDPHFTTANELRRLASQRGINVSAAIGDDIDTWLQLLWTHVVEPHLAEQGGPVFVIDYPASQAMLSRLRPGSPPVAERFELYIEGVEIANGFNELTEGDEQRQRFEADLLRREALGLPPMPTDERLLAALKHGLPACSGVALGIDRLLMYAIDATAIGDVVAFPLSRC